MKKYNKSSTKWRVDNKEHLREYNRKWRKKNSEKCKKYQADYFQKNKKRVTRQQKKHRSKPEVKEMRRIGAMKKRGMFYQRFHSRVKTTEQENGFVNYLIKIPSEVQGQMQLRHNQILDIKIRMIKNE